MPGEPIGERIRARVNDHVRARGWTQKEFATRVGRQQSWASKYLGGDIDADVDLLAKIASVLEVPFMTLLEVQSASDHAPPVVRAQAIQIAAWWPDVPEHVRAPMYELVKSHAERARAERESAEVPASGRKRATRRAGGKPRS